MNQDEPLSAVIFHVWACAATIMIAIVMYGFLFPPMPERARAEHLRNVYHNLSLIADGQERERR